MFKSTTITLFILCNMAQADQLRRVPMTFDEGNHRELQFGRGPGNGNRPEFSTSICPDSCGLLDPTENANSVLVCRARRNGDLGSLCVPKEMGLDSDTCGWCPGDAFSYTACPSTCTFTDRDGVSRSGVLMNFDPPNRPAVGSQCVPESRSFNMLAMGSGTCAWKAPHDVSNGKNGTCFLSFALFWYQYNSGRVTKQLIWHSRRSFNRCVTML